MIFRHLLNMLSHPTWVRGLKPKRQCIKPAENKVAPYVGAWIETFYSPSAPPRWCVAPYVGAWIETSLPI